MLGWMGESGVTREPRITTRGGAPSGNSSFTRPCMQHAREPQLCVMCEALRPVQLRPAARAPRLLYTPALCRRRGARTIPVLKSRRQRGRPTHQGGLADDDAAVVEALEAQRAPRPNVRERLLAQPVAPRR